MREGEEHRLELRRRDVDALREQVPEERAVALGVACLRVVEVADAAVGHEWRKHRADAAHVRDLSKAGFETGSFPLELLVHRRVTQTAKDGEPGCGRERVAAQG